MAKKPTKFVVVFDDGSTYDIPADTAGSIFVNEEKAKKCGHNPPYGKPPAHSSAGGGGGSGDADAGSGGGAVTLMDTGDSCYVINGVIVCP